MGEGKRLGQLVICPKCLKVVNPHVQRTEPGNPSAGIKERDVVKCPIDECQQVWYVTHLDAPHIT